MTRRAAVPRISVILVLEGASQYVVRAIESVQGQNIHDLQLIVSYRDVAPGVAHSLQLVADRDIHIDLMPDAGADLAECAAAALDRARGSHVMLMRDFEWFAPDALENMLSRAQETGADIVFPSVSYDRYDIHRERHSHVASLGSVSLVGRDALRNEFSRVVESGLVGQVTGALVRRDLWERFPRVYDVSSLGAMCHFLGLSGCIAGEEQAVFHTSAPSIAETFDPMMFSRACLEAEELDGLLRQLGLDDSPEAVLACGRVYYDQLVSCIENLCLSPHSISSIERNARLRDMLDSDRTRRVVASLKMTRKGLGMMFKPIESGRVFSCVLRSHLADFLNLSMNKTA